MEAARAGDAAAHRWRGASEWSWRLAVARNCQYYCSAVHRHGDPLGYIVVRRLTAGSRQLGKVATAIVTDLTAVDGQPDLLRALVRKGVAIAADLRVSLLLAATTTPGHCRAQAQAGFLAPGFPLAGRFLQRRSPQFLWLPRGVAAGLSAGRMALTFADSDMDLSL